MPHFQIVAGALVQRRHKGPVPAAPPQRRRTLLWAQMHQQSRLISQTDGINRCRPCGRRPAEMQNTLGPAAGACSHQAVTHRRCGSSMPKESGKTQARQLRSMPPTHCAPLLERVLQRPQQQPALALATAASQAAQRLLAQPAQLAVRQQRGDEDLAQRIDGLRQGALTRATWPRLTPRACSMPEHQPNIGLVRLRSPELRRLSSGMHASAGEPSSTCCHDRLCRPGATPGRPWRARRCACRPT